MRLKICCSLPMTKSKSADLYERYKCSLMRRFGAEEVNNMTGLRIDFDYLVKSIKVTNEDLFYAYFVQVDNHEVTFTKIGEFAISAFQTPTDIPPLDQPHILILKASSKLQIFCSCPKLVEDPLLHVLYRRIFSAIKMKMGATEMKMGARPAKVNFTELQKQLLGAKKSSDFYLYGISVDEEEHLATLHKFDEFSSISFEELLQLLPADQPRVVFFFSGSGVKIFSSVPQIEESNSLYAEIRQLIQAEFSTEDTYFLVQKPAV